MSDDTTPPEPLSLDQAKGQLRVDTTDEDALIDSLIVAAREYVEDYTGVVLVRRSVTETADKLGSSIELRSWPIVSVDAIRCPTSGGVLSLTVGAWQFSAAKRPVRVLPVVFGWGVGMSFGSGWRNAPSLPVEIEVTAGFATPDDVPATIKQAMLLLIQHWYDNRAAAEVGTRAAAIEVPFAVEALLRRWRLVTI